MGIAQCPSLSRNEEAEIGHGDKGKEHEEVEMGNKEGDTDTDRCNP